MDFGFTEEQELLRAEVRKFLDQSCPIPEVRRIAEAGAGLPGPLWKQVAELGWPGLTIAEEHGGAGLGFEDLVVVLEETGRSLFPAPLLSTTLAAAAIREAGSAEQQARWLPRLADGSAVGTLALLEADDRLGPEGVNLAGVREGDGFVLSGEKLFVHDAGAADLFLVPFRQTGQTGQTGAGAGAAALGLAVVERDARGVRAEDVPGIDLTRRTGRLRLADVRVGADALLGAAPAAAVLARVLDLAACAVAAEMVGAAEAALQLTVGYAKDRVQFGEPIGRFQGVKHPLAEMYVDVESVKSLVYYAAWALDTRQPEASLAASRAKAYATEAFSRIGLDVVQLHGGIGYTWEYDAQLYLKRAKWARPAFGDAGFHYERVAALGGL
jgi:alkylation response protein AidB-like acyl-CoA dehydrogenase